VKTVASWFLVMLTYNLHDGRPAVISEQVKSDLELKEALARLLKDSASFPEGGFIGFGLSYKYPFDVKTTELSDIEKNLKVPDAAIKRACELISLPVSVKAVYYEDFQAVLLDKFVNIDYHVYGSLLDHLETCYKGKVVIQESREIGNWYLEYPPIVWVGPLPVDTNSFAFSYLTEHHMTPLTYADSSALSQPYIMLI
jgi:hypothetical protein